MASQCNILSDGGAADANKYHDALLHAEKHIDKLERHLGLMEKGASDYEGKLQIEREAAASRYADVLRLRSELAKCTLDELKG